MALVPQNIKTLVPYKAGRRIEDVLREHNLTKAVKLASNENPFGPSPRALSAARDALLEVHRYPDPLAQDLRAALAQRFMIRPANVIAGNGSESILSTIVRTFLLPSEEIIAAQNSFIGFRVLARSCGRPVNWIPMREYRHDLEGMADAINEYTKLIYLVNPDNPTGSHFTVEEFDAFMARVPSHVLVILDEAYFEFACTTRNYPDSMHYRYDNVITLRTFSKAHGLAGMRIGYGFAHHELIENLLKVKLPFEPSHPAQAAALAALEDDYHLQMTLTNNRTELVYLQTELKRLGMRTLPSAANFVTLVMHDEQQAARITEKLLHRGVIVRLLDSFGWPCLIRVTVGLPEENRTFIEHLSPILSETP